MTFWFSFNFYLNFLLCVLCKFSLSFFKSFPLNKGNNHIVSTSSHAHAIRGKPAEHLKLTLCQPHKKEVKFCHARFRVGSDVIRHFEMQVRGGNPKKAFDLKIGTCFTVC
jgi:hypothetical protein